MVKMAAWSGLLRSAGQILLRNKTITPNQALNNGTVVRLMSEHRTFPVVPSRWSWEKTKDLFHFYVCVAAIPIGIGICLVNIFVGPAQLQPIPEGYVPKCWEYYRHPITRFLQRYILTSDQQEYEKYIHHIWTEQEVTKCRQLEAKVKSLMKKRIDYQAYYYQPFDGAKYVRQKAQQQKDSLELYAKP